MARRKFIPIFEFTKEQEGRFWSYVDQPEIGCWEWKRYRKENGYGTIGRKIGKGFESILASRVAYKLTYGVDPEALHVCHSCDNPPCVRPSHLFLGTQKQNIRDMVEKGRFPNQSGESNRNCKITFEQATLIRKLKKYGLQVKEIAAATGCPLGAIRGVLYSGNWKLAQ